MSLAHPYSQEMYILNHGLPLTALLLFACLAGCAAKAPPPNLPTVHKVTGKVLDKSTKQPITEGAVQFESLAEQGRVGLADIGPDGTFTMTTFVDNQRLEGLVAGPQRATFLPRTTQDQSAKGPVTLNETFEVKAGDNEFILEVEP